jgi:hypothetical protein
MAIKFCNKIYIKTRSGFAIWRALDQIKSIKKNKSYQIGERMREVLVEIPKTEPRKEQREQIALQVNEEWKTLSYIGRKFVALAKRIPFF